MLKLVAELSRFSQFINQRPLIEELLNRLYIDFLAFLKPNLITLAAIAAPGKFKVTYQVGNMDQAVDSLFNGSSLELKNSGENLVDQLINQAVIPVHKDQRTLLSGISNGKMLSGLLATNCQSAPSEEDKNSASPILLLSSFYLFPKITENQFSVEQSNGYSNHLTPRQRQVLSGFIEGKTNHELAIELGFSISTIRHETMAIFKSLGVSDRKEAAKFAQQKGLV